MEEKSYELSNHLGNVHMTLSDYRRKEEDGLGVVYFSQVKSASDYYPFGQLLTDGNYSAKDYRFGFNGKEMDNEVKGTGNQYDYGFRIYNPRIAKFLSVDPLTKDYPWYTPYQFAGNKPIWAVDLDGLEEKEANVLIRSMGAGEAKQVNEESLDIQRRSWETASLVLGGLYLTGVSFTALAINAPSASNAYLFWQTTKGMSGIYSSVAGFSMSVGNTAGKSEKTDKLPHTYPAATIGISIDALRGGNDRKFEKVTDLSFSLGTFIESSTLPKILEIPSLVGSGNDMMQEINKNSTDTGSSKQSEDKSKEEVDKDLYKTGMDLVDKKEDT